MNFNSVLETAQRHLETAVHEADSTYALVVCEDATRDIVVQRYWLTGQATHYIGDLYFRKNSAVIRFESARRNRHSVSRALLEKIVREIERVIASEVSSGRTVSITGLDILSGYLTNGKVTNFPPVFHSSLRTALEM
ncbi:hypothetical protein HY490_04820 [Candidatus Woesearchaeota archaeon]|nr:hypothetical protein [Candidatus Woesearchaeota archaeon]